MTRLAGSLTVVLGLSLGIPLTGAGQQPAGATVQAPAQRPPVRKSAVSKALSPVEQRIQAVETHLVPAVRIKGKPAGIMTLAARMKKYHVPGVSIAVINDYGLEWVRAYGDVDTLTRFQAGAAGEPVAAILALRLAQARKFDLNRDVNRALKSWKIPKSDITRARATTPRALLAHSSGLTVTASQPFEQGVPRPPLIQILSPIAAVTGPGEETRYSAADYDVIEQLITDVVRRPFGAIATDSVLVPLGMRHSGFGEPADASLAATGHDTAGHALAGKWTTFSELAAAGLWTTPGDLAQIALAIERAGAGKGGSTVNREIARQILTAEHVGWPGLGVTLEGRDQSARFRTTGETPGFSATVLAYLSRGQGAVVMTDGALGGPLTEEILNAVAVAYGWPDFVPAERTVARVDVRVYDRFVGRYASDSREVSVTRRGNRLYIGPAGQESTEMLPQSVSEFFTTDPGAFYSFVFDDHGKVQAFTETRRMAYTRWNKK